MNDCSVHGAQSLCDTELRQWQRISWWVGPSLFLTLVACRFSINMRHKDKDELKEAQQGMPIPVPGCDGVYHCGFHAANSFAATSYIIQRPEGNIMVDSPRYNSLLAKNIEELGGIKYIWLSHMCAFLSTLHIHAL